MKIQMVSLAVFVAGLTGCVDSSDYVEFWESGSVDSGLAGQWSGQADHNHYTVNISIVSNAYDVHVATSVEPHGTQPASQHSFSSRSKSVSIGTNTFMLCESFNRALLEAAMRTNLPVAAQEPTRATLLRYDRQDDDIVFRHLNWDLVQKAIDEGSIKGIKTPPLDQIDPRWVPSPHLDRFDKETLAKLAEIFQQSNAWHSMIVFEREEH
jgi:hypothetical protein